jgi:hypothetical protein
MATALAICQEFSRRTGLAVPSSLFAGDVQALQLASLLNELCEEITTRFQWQELLKRKTSWTSLAAEDQGTLATIFGTSLINIIAMTLWDETERTFINGPLTTSDFQADQVSSVGGSAFAEYKIYDNHLYITPAPAAGHSLTAFYKVNTWATDSGGTAKSSITADSDVILFPEALVKLGLRYKWKEEKGLPYAELLRSFEGMTADLLANNSSARKLSMADCEGDYRPGIWVPIDSPVTP